VETLLATCSGVVLLTTAREALRVDGECVFRVRPLPIEEHSGTGPALDLLVARLTDADFTQFSQLTSDDRAQAATICKRLDGVPLALELAAGRARDLPLANIVAGLEERFGLLAGGRRTAEPRQQTLRGMIDWSFTLLGEREQELFARLGLFAAAFTAEAAGEVCADDPTVFHDALGGLIAKSLVAVVEDGDRRLRYRLLETIRAYALDRLRESGQYDRSAHRFAVYFCERAKAADARYGRISNRTFLDLVEADIDNFRAALDWTLGRRNDTLLGAELAGAMGWIYRQMALLGEGTRWAERAVAESTGLEPAADGRLHMSLSSFFFNLGDLKRAFEAAIHATGVFRAAHRQSDLCWALTQQVYCLYLLGRPDEALFVGEEAVAVARAEHDAFRLAGALNAFALTIPIERAQERFSPLEEAIRAYREAGDADAIVPTANLAEAHYATGNFASALACGLQVVAMTRENRDRSNLGSALANVAAYALTVEDVEQADRAAREALELVRNLGMTRNAMCALQHLGSVAARRGRYVRAARLEGASNGLYRAFGLEREFTEQSLYDRTLGELRAGLGVAAAAAHLDDGAALPIESAITEALLSA
jgi:predicted ATPase